MTRIKIFVAVLVLLGFASVSGASFLLDRVAAVVNQEVITWSELYRSMEADASPSFKSLKDEEKARILKDNEAVFLNNLINYRLQLQEARHAGIRVGDDEIKEALENIRKKYSMTEAVFLESLKSEGFGLEDYKKRLQEQIIISKVVNQQIRNKIVVTDEDLNKFMAENKDLLSGSESFRIRQIFFRKQKNEAENKKAEENAEMVYKKLQQGENFGDLAKQYSEDASKDMGGDLGFIEKASLAKEFSTALAMLKPGDFSRPFSTDRGFHIIKFEEKTQPKTGPELKADAQNMLNNKIFSEKYNAWIKSLREKSFIDIRL